MELKQIEAFLMIVEKGSFSAAASELYITQPTISVRVQQLEQELNTTLFKRVNGQRVVLSSEGERVLPYFQEAISLIKTAENILNPASSEVKTIKISCPNHLGEVILSDLLSDLYDYFPKTEFQVTIEVTKDILNKADYGEIDVAFIYSPEDLILKNEEYITYPIYETKTILVSSPDHPLAKKKEVSAELLKKERIIIYDHMFITTRIIKEFLKQHVLESYEPVEINNLNSIKKMLQKKLGVSFLQDIAVKDEIALNHLVELPLMEEISPTPISLMINKSISNEVQSSILQFCNKFFNGYTAEITII